MKLSKNLENVSYSLAISMTPTLTLLMPTFSKSSRKSMLMNSSILKASLTMKFLSTKPITNNLVTSSIRFLSATLLVSFKNSFFRFLSSRIPLMISLSSISKTSSRSKISNRSIKSCRKRLRLNGKLRLRLIRNVMLKLIHLFLRILTSNYTELKLKLI